MHIHIAPTAGPNLPADRIETLAYGKAADTHDALVEYGNWLDAVVTECEQRRGEGGEVPELLLSELAIALSQPREFPNLFGEVGAHLESGNPGESKSERTSPATDEPARLIEARHVLAKVRTIVDGAEQTRE